MPVANDLAWNGLLISTGITLIAVFLGLRQWYESRARGPDLTSADRGHFRSQDLRRSVGIAVLLVLAAALSIGTRIDHKVNGRTNPTFVEIWLFVLALIIVLVTLAMLDSLATLVYARRQRRAMARERIRLLRDVVRKPSSAPPEPPGEDERSSTQ